MGRFAHVVWRNIPITKEYGKSILEISRANPSNFGNWYADLELSILAAGNYSYYSDVWADALEGGVQNNPESYDFVMIKSRLALLVSQYREISQTFTPHTR